MTAKEYLQQLHKADVIINQRIQEKVLTIQKSVSRQAFLKAQDMNGRLPGSLTLKMRLIP